MAAFPWARSVVLGWATLLGIALLVERPLLHWTSPLFGPMWIATVHLSLDALALAAAGYVAGRLNRRRAILAGAVLAASLCLWDFGELLALNVPFLLKVAWDSLHDSRFVESLIGSVETHVALFGCLTAGAALAREREKPVSIATTR